MSAQINCDRCGQNTRLRFFNAKIEIARGIFASVYSKLSPAHAGTPWRLEWHLCEPCARSLQDWSKPPADAA